MCAARPPATRHLPHPSDEHSVSACTHEPPASSGWTSAPPTRLLLSCAMARRREGYKTVYKELARKEDPKRAHQAPAADTIADTEALVTDVAASAPAAPITVAAAPPECVDQSGPRKAQGAKSGRSVCFAPSEKDVVFVVETENCLLKENPTEREKRALKASMERQWIRQKARSPAGRSTQLLAVPPGADREEVAILSAKRMREEADSMGWDDDKEVPKKFARAWSEEFCSHK